MNCMNWKNLGLVVLASLVTIPIAACGGKDTKVTSGVVVNNPVAPSTPTAVAPFGGAKLEVGLTQLNEGWVLIWGNTTGMQDIGDYNGSNWTLFVTASSSNVKKYQTEYGNSVAVVDGQNKPGTMLRAINFGDAVKFELRIIKRGEKEYTQITWPNKDNKSLFQYAPSNLKIDGIWVTGPLPEKDKALRALAGGGNALMDDIVAMQPMPKTCEVPAGQTDCEAK